MKLLLALLLIPTVGFSQITITDADFGTSGDTVRMSSTTDLAVDFSSTGTSFNWDFTSFVAESQTLLEFNNVSSASTLVQILFGGFAPANYQASYFQVFDDLPIDQFGQLLPVNISNLFQFSKITSDSVSSVGISIDVDGNQIPFRSEGIEKRYALPLNFGDTYSGTGFTEMDLNPIAEIIWRQRRTRSSEVDGWGTVTLPMGTFDVIRVRHTVEENDSLYQDFLGTGNPTWFGIDLPTAYIYEWIANGENEVVLRIETSEFGGMETVRNIEYRDSYDPNLASIDALDFVDVTIYPNPVTNSISIDGINGQLAYSIIDANGTMVKIGTISSQEPIDVSNLSSGNYVILGQTAQGSIRSSFVKN